MFLLNQEKLLISDEFSFFKMTVIVGNFLTTNIGQILFVHLNYEIFFCEYWPMCISCPIWSRLAKVPTILSKDFKPLC